MNPKPLCIQQPPAATPHTSTGSTEAISGPNWTILVENIVDDNQSGMEELYRIFSKGVRFHLCRQFGPQDLEDKVHDIFLIVVRAVRAGKLRDPQCLMGLVRTVLKRQVAAHIDQAIRRRQDLAIESAPDVVDVNRNPEKIAIGRQYEDIAKSVLRMISERDREVLTRFYMLEQCAGQICDQMHLTETQFRLLKSRAKARFENVLKRRLARRGVAPPFNEKVGTRQCRELCNTLRSKY